MNTLVLIVMHLLPIAYVTLGRWWLCRTLM